MNIARMALPRVKRSCDWQRRMSGEAEIRAYCGLGILGTCRSLLSLRISRRLDEGMERSKESSDRRWVQRGNACSNGGGDMPARASSERALLVLVQYSYSQLRLQRENF